MTDNFGNLGDMAQEHGDQISAGADKAGDLIDEKTGGQYSDQIQQGEDAVAEHLGVEGAGTEPGAEPGAEAGAEPGAEQGLAPGDTETQPTTDASVQPEGGDYAAEGAETTSGGEYGSEPTETSGETGEPSEFGAEGEQQF